ncbi:MAG: hypothetical protein KGS72_27270 [Cyanobacteria bacterium REEB67]|nr:hypothetical protein [Cyanobacteria bacterium REEB67]
MKYKITAPLCVAMTIALAGLFALAWSFLSSNYAGILFRLEIEDLFRQLWPWALAGSFYCAAVCMITIGSSAAVKAGVKAFFISLALVVVAMVLIAITAVGNFHG